MKDLLIFPFNGNGLEALSCLGENFRFLGFVDDTPGKLGKHELGFTVYGRHAFQDFPEALVLAIPGSPSSFSSRQILIEGLNIPDSRFATVLHPRAEVSVFSKIGRNTLLMSGVVLTSNCFIGDHVCILPNTVIHHDSKVGNYTLIGSNVTVAGNSTVGDNCYIGSGSSIINGIHIGEKSLVGIGTNVIKDLPALSKSVGNPARLL